MCAPLGMYETLKPLVGTILTRKSSGNSLSQHVGVEISGSQAHLGDGEIKQKHKLLHGGNAVSKGQSGSLLVINHVILQKNLEVLTTLQASLHMLRVE